jgi:hypothetical protein
MASFAAILGAIALVQAGAGSAPPVNALYVADQDGFQARFPGPVQLDSRIINWNEGQVAARLYRSELAGQVFQVSVLPLPESATKDRKPDQVLKAAQSGTLQAPGLVVEAEQAFELNGVPALRYLVQLREGPLLAHLMVLQGNRLFHALAVVPRDQVAGAVEFLRTFELTTRKDDVTAPRKTGGKSGGGN